MITKKNCFKSIFLIMIQYLIEFTCNINSYVVDGKRNIQTSNSNITSNSTSTNLTNTTNSTVVQSFLIQNVFKELNVTIPPFGTVEKERITVNNTIFVKYDFCHDISSTDMYNVDGICKNTCPVGYRELVGLKYCYRCPDYTKYFYRGNCSYNSCPENTIANKEKMVCEECIWSGKYFFENKCHNKCFHYLAVDETKKLCINCRDQKNTTATSYLYGSNECKTTASMLDGFGTLNRKYNVIGYCNRVGKSSFFKLCINKCYSGLSFILQLEEGMICNLFAPAGMKSNSYDLYNPLKRVIVRSCSKYSVETSSACNHFCPSPVDNLYFKNFTLVNETIRCLNETIYPTEIKDNNSTNNSTNSLTPSSNTNTTSSTNNTTSINKTLSQCLNNTKNEDFIIKNESGSSVNVTKVTDLILTNSTFSCIVDKNCKHPRVIKDKVCLWNITEYCHTTNICGLDSTCSMINTNEFICHCTPGKEAYGLNCRFSAAQYIEALIKVTSTMEKLEKITVVSNIPLSLINEISSILPFINNFPSLHPKIYDKYFFVKKMISYFDQIYVSSKKELNDKEIADLNSIIPNIINSCVYIMKTMVYQVKSKDKTIFDDIIFFMEMINYLSQVNLKLAIKKENFNELSYSFLILNNTNYFAFALNENTLNRHYLYREFYDIVDFDSCLLKHSMKYYIVFLEMNIDLSNIFKKLIGSEVDLLSNPYFISLLNIETNEYEEMNCPIRILATLREKEKILTIDNQNSTLRLIKELSINPLDLDDDFFTSDCYYYEKNGTFANMTINDRIKHYYKNLSLKLGVFDIRNKTFYNCDMDYIEKDKSFEYVDKFFFTCDKIVQSGWYFYYYTKKTYVDYNPLQTIFSNTKCFSKGLNFPDNLASVWFYIVNAIIIAEVSLLITHFLTYERFYEVHFTKIFFFDLDYYYYHLLPAMIIKPSKKEKLINNDNIENNSDDDFKQ